MAGQIGDEHPVACRKRGCEGAPVLDRPAETVHEHERRTGPADRIAKPCSTPLELSFLESVQAVFAVRHQEGIFFANGFFWRAGRVMPATTTSKGAI
jgi:hypothetical protein